MIFSIDIWFRGTGFGITIVEDYIWIQVKWRGRIIIDYDRDFKQKKLFGGR